MKIDTGIDRATQQKITRIIKAFLPTARIYLFGSRARQTHSTWSDIDLAIDAEKEVSRFDIGEIKSVLDATNIIYKIDIVDFWSVPIDMQNSIKKEGIEWRA